MNPLRQDDPRHLKALEAAANIVHAELVPVSSKRRPIRTATNHAIDAYHESLKEQGVVLVEAYPGDDAK